MSGAKRSRRRRWLATAFTVGLWAFIVVGTIATVPALVRDGGWLAVAGCAAWSFGCAVVMVLLLYVGFRIGLRRPKFELFSLLLAFATVLLMLLVPPVTTVIAYGAEAATAAGYVAVLSGWGTIWIWAVLASRGFEERNAEAERFRARFEEGPIGNWRGVRTDLQDADGSGHFRLWDTPDTESSSECIDFHWRLDGESLIDISLVSDQPDKRIRFVVVRHAGIAKLMLTVAGASLPDQLSSEIGFAEFDEVSWPRFFVFEYIGEPASGVTSPSLL
jgi:hypothetical protein